MSRSYLLITLLFIAISAKATETQGNDNNVDETFDATAEFDMFTEDSETSSTTQSPVLFTDKDLRLSIAQQTGLNLNNTDEVVSNRFDTRLRWEKLLNDHWYMSIDGKLILRLKGDDQIEKNNNWGYNLRLYDLNIQSQFERLSVKTGYQTIIWGEMDSVPINDVMTPWDYSEFAFTTPEDARLGQASIIASYFFKNSSLTFVYTPYPLANRFPGGEASSLLETVLGTSNYTANENFPIVGRDYEIGLRYKHTVGKSDIALYLASVLSDFPRFELTSSVFATPLVFNISYPQYELAGLSANYSAGNFLWKYETAFKNQVYFPGIQAIYRDTFENAIGLDYNANGAYNLTIEIYNQTILNGQGNLIGYKPNNSQIIGRWNKTFFHETLSTIYYISYQLQFKDTTHSIAIQYAINDFWRLDFNVTVFDIRNKNSPNAFIDDWDQVTARVTFDI